MVRLVIARAVGNLPASYYSRQFLLGLVLFFVAGFAFQRFDLTASTAAWLYALLFVNTVLYPFARIGYECSLGYVLGFRRLRSSQSWIGDYVGSFMADDGVPILRVGVEVVLGMVIVAICWSCAVVIGPLSLVYLYIFNDTGSER